MWLFAVGALVLVVGSAIVGVVYGIEIIRMERRHIDWPLFCHWNRAPAMIAGIALLLAGIAIAFLEKWDVGLIAIIFAWSAVVVIASLFNGWWVRMTERKVGHKLRLADHKEHMSEEERIADIFAGPTKDSRAEDEEE